MRNEGGGAALLDQKRYPRDVRDQVGQFMKKKGLECEEERVKVKPSQEIALLQSKQQHKHFCW